MLLLCPGNKATILKTIHIADRKEGGSINIDGELKAHLGHSKSIDYIP